MSNVPEDEMFSSPPPSDFQSQSQSQSQSQNQSKGYRISPKRLEKLLKEAEQSVNAGSTSAFDDESTWTQDTQVHPKFPMDAKEEFQKLKNRKFSATTRKK